MTRDAIVEANRLILENDREWMRAHPERRFHIRPERPVEGGGQRVRAYLGNAVVLERTGERGWRSRKIYVVGSPVDTDAYARQAIRHHDDVLMPMLLDDARRSSE